MTNLLHPAWLDDFAIPADAAGTVLALDFSDAGLWMARLDRDRNVVATVVEERIVPYVLDVRTASELRDAGVVPEAVDPVVLAELTDTVSRVRSMLVDRDSVLATGSNRLRLITVTLDNVMSATVPEVNRAHGMIVELAGDEPVAAILMSPGTDQWPGLWETLTERGYTMLLPGDPFPQTFAGDNEHTFMFQPLEPATGHLAWEESDETDEDEALSGAQAVTGARRSRRGRWLAVAAVVGAAAVAAAVIAYAMNRGGETKLPSEVIAATTSTAIDQKEAEQRPAGTASPDDISAARANMSPYKPPPPKTTMTTQEPSPVETGPRPQPRPRDNRRTIPNPIPGLPPIVIG